MPYSSALATAAPEESNHASGREPAVTALAIALSASIGSHAFGAGLRRRSFEGAVGRALRAGRDDGGGGRRQELEGAAHVVGTAEPRRRLEHRRHAQHPVEPARELRHARHADARGIQAAREPRRRRQGSREQPRDVSAQRMGHPHVRLLVARGRPGRRQGPGAARPPRRPQPAEPRHVRPRPVQHFRRLHALRSLHHARPDRLAAARDLRQRPTDRTDSGRRRDQLRNDPRHARHSARQAPAHRRERRAVHGQRARTLGRRHARRREHELHRTRRASASTATARATAIRSRSRSASSASTRR